MAEIFCNTSPLQYLHQLQLLHLLPAIAGTVIVPPAVTEELARGREAGVSLPDITGLDWLHVRAPRFSPSLPAIGELGPGETQVLALALESIDPVCILDDALARRAAEALRLRLTGTLGVLLDAKHAGLVPALAPLLDRLDALKFRLAPHTRRAILQMAGE